MTLSRATGPSHRRAPVASRDEHTTDRLLTAPFVALLLVNAVFSFGLSTFFLLPKFMTQQLHVGATEIGAVTTAFGLTMLLSVPWIGRLLDGSRNRGVVVASCAILALAALGFVWVDSFGPGLVVLRCLQGLSLAMFSNAGGLIVSELAPKGRLAQAVGLFAGTGMVMTAIAPAFVEWLTERMSYRPAFALASAAAALAALLSLRLHPGSGAHAIRSSMRAVLFRASSLRMVLVLASAGIGFGVMFAFSQPFALELGMKNVRGFFLAFATAAVLVRVSLGRTIDRVGPRRIATGALLGYGAVVAGMYVLQQGRLELLGGLFGLAHGLFIPAFNAFIVEGSLPHERGKLITLFNGAFNLGNCTVVALGVLAERVGYPVVFALTGALILAAPLLMIGWPERPTHGVSP